MAQITSTTEIKEKLLTDRRFFIENLIRIPDKTRSNVPFKFNRAQEILYNGILDLQNSELPCRLCILKARQIGITSLICALFLVECITRPNTTSIIVAHEEFITQRLLEKAKVFEASIPTELKPEMHHKSAYELYWRELHSTFYIGSARSFVCGRGERIDNALCSEIAFWHDPERILVPLGESIPITGMLFLESTPNGEMNHLHDIWVQSVNRKSGQAPFQTFFFPWWIEPGYALPANGSPLIYSSDERYLVETHGLSDEQILWRRMKLASNLGRMFFQEYPEDDKSCFLQVKESVFNQDLITEKSYSCYPAPSSYEGADVWQHPEEGHIYHVGADPTVGIYNPAAATVWDMLGLRLCARLSGPYEPYVFAEKLRTLGKYYNNACLAIENNNPGLAVLSHLMDYVNLYYQRDIITGRPTNRPGWVTSSATKSYMIQQFKQLLPSLVIPDVELLRQLRNFRYDGMSIISVEEDDIAISAMIALATRDALPTTPALVGVSGWQTW